MAQINQQSTPSGSISLPASGSVALFSEPTDLGRLYLKDSDGNVYPAVSGSGGGGSGLIPIQNDTTPVGSASTLNFAGTAVDSIAVNTGVATINLSGGTSGSSGADGTSGSSGANGADGTSGSSGADGTSGSSGADGTSGSSGANGADGTSGSSGANGTSGSSGANGVDGTSGSSGSSGANGADGTSGSSGADGTSGSSGANGADGTSGSSGADGTSGSSGANGADGTSGSSGSSGNTGASGTSGSSGADGTSGSSGSSGAAGADGDRYQTVSTTTFTLNASGTLTVGTGLAYSVAQQILIVLDASNYQVSEVTAYNSGTGVISFAFPTELVGSGTASSWDVNLAGASGGDGTSGSSGANGADGTSGSSGANGTSGSSGANGTSGSSGANGVDGTSGSSGSSGANGVDGTSGSSGSSGATGTSGSSGANGTSGSSGSAGSDGAAGNPGTSGTSGSSGAEGAGGTSGSAGSSGLTGTSGTSAAGGGGTPYTNVVRYEVASGSDKAQLMSAGNTISGLSWARTTTTVTITSTAHGLTTGDYVVLRNFNVDYVYAEITVTSVNLFTVQVANSGDTSGTAGVYIPAFDVTSLSETVLTIEAPSAGNCQLLSIQVFINSSDTGTITVTLPSNALENGAGGNNTLDNRNPPQAAFYNVTGSNSSKINAGGVSFSMSGNHNIYTLAGSLDIFGSLMYTLHF